VEGSTDDRLSCDARGGDHVSDVGDDRLVRRDLEGQAGTRIARRPVPFDVRRVDHPLGVVLTLGGELDLATVPALREQLDRAMRGKGAVVIDLSALRFIDLSGLRVLVRADRQLRASGGQLVLVYGSRGVRRVFELTSLDRYFASCDAPGAALRTARERRIGSRRIPKSAANQQTAAELDRELPGAMWS